eukprot:1177569-Prorocentrum_minimum.AAC.1
MQSPLHTQLNPDLGFIHHVLLDCPLAPAGAELPPHVVWPRLLLLAGVRVLASPEELLEHLLAVLGGGAL